MTKSTATFYVVKHYTVEVEFEGKQPSKSVLRDMAWEESWADDLHPYATDIVLESIEKDEPDKPVKKAKKGIGSY